MSYNEYNADAVDNEQDETEREGFQQYKEYIVFLIDASSSMLKKAEVGEELKDYEGDSWLEIAVKVAREVLKTRIIASDSDQQAIVFYGTREVKNDNGFEGVYVFQNLDNPEAKRIRDLQDLLEDGKFEQEVGSTSRRSPDNLRYGLWTASQVLNSATTKASKRIMIFTNDDNPPGKGAPSQNAREQILGRATVLHEERVALQLFPLVAQDREFGMEFWSELLKIENEEEMWEYAGSEVPFRLKNLSSNVRQKGHKKRPLATLPLRFTPDFEIAVQLYNMLQPATKGAPMQVDQDNRQLQAQSALVSADTGSILTDIPKRRFPKERPPSSFPPVIVLMDEIAEVRQLKRPGLQLLGFKPLSALKDYHQVRNSTFVYPSERTMAGSTAVFVAFHEEMVRLGRFALCSFVRNKTAEARLVALLPQQEEKDEHGEQLTPPGYQMIYLPFSDDIRSPETDPDFVGPISMADEAQVAAAEALVSALSLTSFDFTNVTNPHLQRHYEVLEALALEVEPEPNENFVDETMPDMSGFERKKPTIIAFRDAVYGEGNDGSKKGAKRKAAPTGAKGEKAEKAPKTEGAGFSDEALVNLMTTEGSLESLTVADLKAACGDRKLLKGGKKADLAKRLADHLSGV